MAKPVKKNTATPAKKSATTSRGRPPVYVPNDAHRNMVQNARSLLGLAEKDIARLIGVDIETLKKHYIDVLETSTHKMHLKIAGMAYKMAMGAPAERDANGKILVDEVKPNPQMPMYFLSRQLKWRESEPVPDQTVKVGETVDGINLADCTPEELNILEGILERKVKNSGAGTDGATKH